MHKKALGIAIEDRLADLNMPRKVFIRQSGISPAYLSEIIRGTKMPSLPMLIDVATTLNMPASALLLQAERHAKEQPS